MLTERDILKALKDRNLKYTYRDKPKRLQYFTPIGRKGSSKMEALFSKKQEEAGRNGLGGPCNAR